MTPEDQQWQSLWQTEPHPLPTLDADALRRKSQRFRWGLIACNIGEILVGLGLIAWMCHRALESGKLSSWVGVLLTVSLLGYLQTLALKNRRGTYQPANHTLRAYLELEVLRTQRMIRTSRFITKFVLIECLLIVPWSCWELSQQDPAFGARMPAALWRGAATLVVLIGSTGLASYFWRRHLEKKLARAKSLVESLDR